MAEKLKLTIVSHCWRYSRLLSYQLSSLILAPPARADVTMTVCYCPDDIKTTDTLLYFAPRLECAKVDLHLVVMPAELLCRRAIGRNKVAKSSDADWAWFTDCDYLFGDGCLDVLADLLPKVPADVPLVYPRVALGCSHEDGDWLIEAATSPAVRSVEGKSFQPRRNRRAIGGIQIARGDVCRKKGYLPGHRRYQKPVDRWRRTFEDRAFRQSLGTRGEPVEIPNLLRIRHSKRGRTDIGVEL